jgi:hypothetical protein
MGVWMLTETGAGHLMSEARLLLLLLLPPPSLLLI